MLEKTFKNLADKIGVDIYDIDTDLPGNKRCTFKYEECVYYFYTDKLVGPSFSPIDSKIVSLYSHWSMSIAYEDEITGDLSILASQFARLLSEVDKIGVDGISKIELSNDLYYFICYDFMVKLTGDFINEYNCECNSNLDSYKITVKEGE